MPEQDVPAGSTQPYSIDLRPRGVLLPPVHAEEYQTGLSPESHPEVSRPRLKRSRPLKFAYPCPFCLEPIPPGDLDSARPYPLCSICRHLILDDWLVVPRARYGRSEEMALLCLEALFIRDWRWGEWVTSDSAPRGKGKAPDRLDEENYKALQLGVSLMVEKQDYFMGKPGDLEEGVISFLESPVAGFGNLAQLLRDTRRFRKQAKDLGVRGAAIKEVTPFQISLVTATSEWAFETGGKDRVLRRLGQRL